MHASKAICSQPLVLRASPLPKQGHLGLSHRARQQPQKERMVQHSKRPQTTQRSMTCAAVPQPTVELAADVSYWLQLASFAVLGGLVIYYTLNYIGLRATLNKVSRLHALHAISMATIQQQLMRHIFRRQAEEAKKKADEEAAK